MRRILFVDDEPAVLEANRRFFEGRGFAADTAETAEQALLLFQSASYACVVLDIQMDGTDGYTLCRILKRQSDVPVVFLTNLSQEECLEKGFISGGDDYMTKPCSQRELELRILARIRSYERTAGGQMLTVGELSFDEKKKQAYLSGRSLALTLNEYMILRYLAENQGQTFTQEELYQNIWQEDSYYNSHSIQTLIARIRKKIALLDPNAQYIRTEWRKGYFLAPPES